MTKKTPRKTLSSTKFEIDRSITKAIEKIRSHFRECNQSPHWPYEIQQAIKTVIGHTVETRLDDPFRPTARFTREKKFPP